MRHWRPDGCTSAASNFHIRLHASRPWGRNVRTAILQHAVSISTMPASGPWGAVVRTVEVKSTISIYVAPASGPQLSNVRTVNFGLRFLPYGDTRPDGISHRPDSWLIFPFLEFGKNQKTVRELRGVRTCCWNIRTDASWNRIFSIQCRGPNGWCLSVWLASGRDDMSFGRMEQWTDGRPDGMARSSGRLTGNLNFFWLAGRIVWHNSE